MSGDYFRYLQYLAVLLVNVIWEQLVLHNLEYILDVVDIVSLIQDGFLEHYRDLLQFRHIHHPIHSLQNLRLIR